MAQQLDFKAVEARGRRMTRGELLYAIEDALAAAEAIGDVPMRGKDSDYYRDEAATYLDVLAQRARLEHQVPVVEVPSGQPQADLCRRALLVLILDPKIRAWLAENDPMALHQAESAAQGSAK